MSIIQLRQPHLSLQAKYEPKTLDEIIYPNDGAETAIASFLEKALGGPTNLILYGPYGTGKTKLANLIAKHLNSSEMDHLELSGASIKNASELGSRISKFASVYPCFSEGVPYKIVILNEADKIPKSAQFDLRCLMDEYKAMASFYITTNEINDIDGAVRDRCKDICYPGLTSSRMLGFAESILAAEGVSVSPQEMLRKALHGTNGSRRKLFEKLDEIIQGASRPKPKSKQTIVIPFQKDGNDKQT